MAISSADGDEVASLLAAARSADLVTIQHLLDNTTVHVDSFDDDHVTALQLAAACNHRPVVEFLLERSADLERCNQVGMTPLLHACRHGNVEVANLLIQKGAKIDRTTYMGASAVALAAAGGHYGLVRRLTLALHQCADPPARLLKDRSLLCPTALMAAALFDRPRICELLTARGAKVNLALPAMQNLTPLAAVVICDLSPQLIDQLLDLGADPNQRVLGDRTALDLAKQFCRVEHCRILERCVETARSTKSCREKLVDIRTVIRNGDLERLQALVEGQESFAALADGATPLMYAVLEGKFPAVKMLVEVCKVDVNAIEGLSKMSSLMQAIVAGQNDIAKYLLKNGANSSLVSANSFTARDLALSSDCNDMDLICSLIRKSSQLDTQTSSMHKRDSIMKRTNWIRKFAQRVVGEPYVSEDAISEESTSAYNPTACEFAHQLQMLNELHGQLDDPNRLFISCEEMLQQHSTALLNGQDSDQTVSRLPALFVADAVALARRMAATIIEQPGYLRPTPLPMNISRSPIGDGIRLLSTSSAASSCHRPQQQQQSSYLSRGMMLALHFSRWDSPARTPNESFGSSKSKSRPPPASLTLAQRNAALYSSNVGNSRNPSISAFTSVNSSRKGSEPVFACRPSSSYDANFPTGSSCHTRGRSLDQASASSPIAHYNPCGGYGGLRTATRRMRSQAAASPRQDYHSPYSQQHQFTFALPRQKTQRSLSSPSLCNGIAGTMKTQSNGLITSQPVKPIVDAPKKILMDNMEITATFTGGFNPPKAVRSKIGSKMSGQTKSFTATCNVSTVLQQLNLSKYQRVFEEQDVNEMDVFLQLQEKDLQRDLGIESDADRAQIMAYIGKAVQHHNKKKPPVRRVVVPPSTAGSSSSPAMRGML